MFYPEYNHWIKGSSHTYILKKYISERFSKIKFQRFSVSIYMFQKHSLIKVLHFDTLPG